MSWPCQYSQSSFLYIDVFGNCCACYCAVLNQYEQMIDAGQAFFSVHTHYVLHSVIPVLNENEHQRVLQHCLKVPHHLVSWVCAKNGIPQTCGTFYTSTMSLYMCVCACACVCEQLRQKRAFNEDLTKV